LRYNISSEINASIGTLYLVGCIYPFPIRSYSLTRDLAQTRYGLLGSLFDWVSLPIEIQDRVLVNYKWSVGYICHLDGTHEETWCAREDFLPARPGFAGGDWTGDPVYEKFAVLRPNTTIQVLQEFFPA